MEQYELDTNGFIRPVNTCELIASCQNCLDKYFFNVSKEYFLSIIQGIGKLSHLTNTIAKDNVAK